MLNFLVMASVLRFWKLCYVEPAAKCSSVGFQSFDDQTKNDEKKDEIFYHSNVEESVLEKRQMKKKNKREA